MKKVLIPTDFSKNAQDALSYAIQLYKNIPTQFFIYHAYQVAESPRSVNKDKILKIIQADAEKDLEALQLRIEKEHDNKKHQFNFHIENGPFIGGTKRLVESENINMIIMGTTGATGAKEIFMGSNAAKVINKINSCPIISVPKDYKLDDISRVIMATDLKKSITETQLKELADLQAEHNLNIEVIRVNEGEEISAEQEENLSTLKKILQHNDITFKRIQKHESIADSVQSYGRAHADLICMLNYEHSFIERLTNEPIVKNISFHSELPLMIIPV